MQQNYNIDAVSIDQVFISEGGIWINTGVLNATEFGVVNFYW